LYSLGEDPTENTAFNSSIIFVGVFTYPLPRNGRLLIRLLHSNGCTCYNIVTWRPKAGIWPSAGRRFAEHTLLANGIDRCWTEVW
jgi:hypothetical protein